MITFKHVSKHYRFAPILIDINVQIHSGEMIILTGDSGAGKSTLLKLIAGIETVSEGEIQVAQHNIHSLSKRRVRAYRRHLGLVFQNPLLLKNRSVYDNVAIALIISGFHQKEIPNRVQDALSQVGLLGKTRALACTLSGGEQQRLSIARAIVHQPRILLADEPTGNLDPNLSQDMMNLFAQLNENGMTIVMATHHPVLAQTGRYLHLEKGHLICTNS